MKYAGLMMSLAVSALMLTACDSSNSSTPTTNNTNNTNATTGGTSDGTSTVSSVMRTIDASDRSNYVYYKLDDLMETPVAVTDPKTDTEWDIAFKRTGIVLNSGASGSGNITGAMIVDQAQFYNGDTPNASVFMNATAENEGKTAFDSVTAETDRSSLTFAEDSNANAITSSDWFTYDRVNHTVSANSAKGWIVRSGAGTSYARFFVKELTTAGRNLASLTLNMAVRGVAQGSFAAAADKTLMFTNGAVLCYDFDADATVDCDTSRDWDLRIDPTGSYTMWLNSAVFGGGQGAIAFGSLDVATPVFMTAPEDVRHWVSDTTKGVFADNSWYAYNLGNNHRIWPNFRVYVIRDGDKDYKVQVQSYYNRTTRDSGFLYVQAQALN